MTENERIKKHIEDCEHRIGNILGFMESNSDADIFSCEENIVVLKEVIIALEEIQQYRAVGTVEYFKLLKGHYQTLNEMCKEYSAIGTVEEFKALKEKNTPKKGIPYTSSNNHKFVECPNCHKDMDLYYDYCQYCGQLVDWGKSKI